MSAVQKLYSFAYLLNGAVAVLSAWQWQWERALAHLAIMGLLWFWWPK